MCCRTSQNHSSLPSSRDVFRRIDIFIRNIVILGKEIAKGWLAGPRIPMPGNAAVNGGNSAARGHIGRFVEGLAWRIAA